VCVIVTNEVSRCVTRGHEAADAAVKDNEAEAEAEKEAEGWTKVTAPISASDEPATLSKSKKRSS
jgi:hypothetical protein